MRLVLFLTKLISLEEDFSEEEGKKQMDFCGEAAQRAWERISAIFFQCLGRFLRMTVTMMGKRKKKKKERGWVCAVVIVVCGCLTSCDR